MILTSHNPPYYASLIEGCGFAKTMDFYAWWIADPERAANRLRRLAPAKKRDAVTIRPIDLWNISGGKSPPPRDLQRSVAGQLGFRPVHRRRVRPTWRTR